jgi:xanthine/CO dehydrogenase XdhC/CoxF family maturation factor
LTEAKIIHQALLRLAPGEKAVFATIVHTEGVTFRKAGAHMLMQAQGTQIGLLSGGCLENDIAEAAMTTLEEGVGRLCFYDLTDDGEALLGYGTGCPGKVWIWLEPIEGPVASSTARLLASQPGPEQTLGQALVYQSDHPCLAAGQRWVYVRDRGFIEGDGLPRSLVERLDECRSLGVSQAFSWEDEQGEAAIFWRPVESPFHCHLFGFGLDVVRLAQHCLFMGWDVSVYHPRLDVSQSGKFPEECRLYDTFAPQFAADLPPANQVAVLMTHQFYRDLEILSALAETPVKFVGMLSSRHRVRTMFEALSEPVKEWLATIEFAAPLGLDLGGRQLDDIALSTVAQLQLYFQGGSGAAKSLQERG